VPLAVVAVVAIEVACKLLIPQEPPPKELARGVEIGPFLRSPFLFGFPSGHVARVAFVVFALRWPLPLALAVMLLVALTRVYSAHHWPSDVMAGWLLGYAVATIARRA
jgi:undecaprenyl-diphosphatase